MTDHIKALEEALRRCVSMLDALVAESGRAIDWGYEDAFRMGEWFEADDLQAIEAARAALAASQTAPDCQQATSVTAQAGQEPVALTYTNWRGETSVRSIIPRGVWFGSTEWHPEPQWLLRAWDTEKDAERDFALKDFGQPAPVKPEEAARVLLADDLLIAKMAEAVHDGPLGADEHWFSAATSQGAWCVDMVRAALRAIGDT